MSRALDITLYNPTFSDSFFFDNNIWMMLFCPIGNYRRRHQKNYSRFFSSLVRDKRGIFINSLVLSEFCNAWLRIEFNEWKRKEQKPWLNYKSHFVGSSIYINTIQDIEIAISNILNHAERMTDSFNAVDVDAILTEMNRCDFNDAYYLEMCAKNSWKIVSHDADLLKNNHFNVDVLTSK